MCVWDCGHPGMYAQACPFSSVLLLASAMPPKGSGKEKGSAREERPLQYKCLQVPINLYMAASHRFRCIPSHVQGVGLQKGFQGIWDSEEKTTKEFRDCCKECSGHRKPLGNIRSPTTLDGFPTWQPVWAFMPWQDHPSQPKMNSTDSFSWGPLNGGK